MDKFDMIYEEEMNGMLISVDKYVSAKKSQGISQMIGCRYGSMWERLVKSAFDDAKEAKIGDKVYYKDYVNKWIKENVEQLCNDCCKESARKLLIEFVDENHGTSIQDMCDFTFEKSNVKYAVDTKYRFHSNDAKTVREIANSARHLKYMGYEPVLLIKTKRAASIKSAIDRFENEGWSIKCDGDALDFVYEMTGVDLKDWLENNVDAWNRLDEYHNGLRELRFDEEKWKF